MPIEQVYFYSYKTKKKGQLWFYTYTDEKGVQKRCRGFLTKRDAKAHYQATYGINPDEVTNLPKAVINQSYIKVSEIQNYIDTKLQEVKANIVIPTSVEPKPLQDIPFKNILEHYLEHIEKTGAKSTHKLYKGFMKNHLQMFTGMNIAEITRKMTKKWRDDKHGSGAGYATINNSIKFTRAAVNYAVDDDDFNFSLCGGKNPFAIKFVDQPYIDVEHLDLEEAFSMLKKCLDKYGFGWFFVFLILACFTGMRQGEIFGIDIEKIDFKNNIIKVRQQYTLGELKGKLKTQSSYRNIDITQFVADIIRAYIRKNRLFSGALLRGNRDANRISRSNFEKNYWVPLKKVCGFENRNITPHSLRGCFTDFCSDEDISMKFVQSMLGHSTIGQTENVYHKKTKKMSENYKNKMQEVCVFFANKFDINNFG